MAAQPKLADLDDLARQVSSLTTRVRALEAAYTALAQRQHQLDLDRARAAILDATNTAGAAIAAAAGITYRPIPHLDISDDELRRILGQDPDNGRNPQ